MGSAKKILAEGRFLRLIDDGGWEYTERVGSSGVVAILGITAAGEVLMVEQFRRSMGRRVLELPAGLAGDIKGSENEAFEEAARRELEEETGYRASKMELLAAGPSAAGSSNTLIHFYLASGLVKTGEGGGDEHEDITVHAVPLKDCGAYINRKVSEGCLADPKLYAGLYFANQWSSTR